MLWHNGLDGQLYSTESAGLPAMHVLTVATAADGEACRGKRAMKRQCGETAAEGR